MSLVWSTWGRHSTKSIHTSVCLMDIHGDSTSCITSRRRNPRRLASTVWSLELPSDWELGFHRRVLWPSPAGLGTLRMCLSQSRGDLKMGGVPFRPIKGRGKSLSLKMSGVPLIAKKGTSQVQWVQVEPRTIWDLGRAS